MNNFNVSEIEKLLNASDYEDSSKINPELYSVIYSLGRDAENEEEYQYAFDILLSLCDRKAQNVRVYAILAMSLLAVIHRRLEREKVESIIKKEWENADKKGKATIQDAVNDINHALNWNLRLYGNCEK